MVLSQLNEALAQLSGEGGIRTLGTRKGTLAFQASPFDHSGNSLYRLLWSGCKFSRIRDKDKKVEAFSYRNGKNNAVKKKCLGVWVLVC